MSKFDLSILILGMGQGVHFEFNPNSRMARYRVTSEFDYKIENKHQLENWKTKRSTLVPYRLPGSTEEVNESHVEIDDLENLQDEEEKSKIHASLHKCPRKPCISQFVRASRLQAH